MNDQNSNDPSAEFLQHHTVERVETAKAGKKRTRVTDQLWIDYYLKHGHIKTHQHLTPRRSGSSHCIGPQDSLRKSLAVWTHCRQATQGRATAAQMPLWISSSSNGSWAQRCSDAYRTSCFTTIQHRSGPKKRPQPEGCDRDITDGSG